MSHLFFKILKPRESEFEMTGPSIVIGRGEKADFRIDDPHCSQAHCKISLNQAGLFIEDLRSKNGTHLNGLKIERAQLFFGDVFRAGDTEFCIHQEKCSSNLHPILIFNGPKDKRMISEIKVGNQSRSTSPVQNLKTKPQTHDEDITQLRLNPLFKDSVKVDQQNKNKMKNNEKEEKKGFLDKLNPFKK